MRVVRKGKDLKVKGEGTWTWKGGKDGVAAPQNPQERGKTKPEGTEKELPGDGVGVAKPTGKGGGDWSSNGKGDHRLRQKGGIRDKEGRERNFIGDQPGRKKTRRGTKKTY